MAVVQDTVHYSVLSPRALTLSHAQVGDHWAEVGEPRRTSEMIGRQGRWDPGRQPHLRAALDPTLAPIAQ